MNPATSKLTLLFVLRVGHWLPRGLRFNHLIALVLLAAVSTGCTTVSKHPFEAALERLDHRLLAGGVVGIGGGAVAQPRPPQKYTLVHFRAKADWLSPYSSVDSHRFSPEMSGEIAVMSGSRNPWIDSPWATQFTVYLENELNQPDREGEATRQSVSFASSREGSEATLVCSGELVYLRPVPGAANLHELGLVYRLDSRKRDRTTLISKEKVIVRTESAGEMQPAELHRLLKRAAATVADKIAYRPPSATTGTR